MLREQFKLASLCLALDPCNGELLFTFYLATRLQTRLHYYWYRFAINLQEQGKSCQCENILYVWEEIQSVLYITTDFLLSLSKLFLATKLSP